MSGQIRSGKGMENTKVSPISQPRQRTAAPGAIKPVVATAELSSPSVGSVQPSNTASLGTRILAALGGQIAPVRASIPYRVMIVLVTCAMLVLPAIYLSLILAVGYCICWYAVNGLGFFSNHELLNIRLLILVYLLPLLTGAGLLLFMIKPLFAPRRGNQKILSISREQEPLLYAFVDQLCGIVGSPRPSRIDIDCQVNASASFNGRFGLVTRNLILTLGLPLVSRLELSELAGVLSHEFGHFAQGSGLRLSYIIRVINIWFARVVFERDDWDRNLVHLSKHGGHWVIQIFAGLCRLMVWITRWILWCLMMIGHLISSFMLRQMEFDADRCEARVSGSDSFEKTMKNIATLSVANQAALSDLAAAWRERRLADDLPMLVCQRERAMPDEVRGAIDAARLKRKTGLFDSHPCDRDRIAAAKRQNTPGIFSFDAPAAALFSDFKELCRLASIQFYYSVLGPTLKPEHLHPTESLVAVRDTRRQKMGALDRYFQGLISPLRPVFLTSNKDFPATPDDCADALMTARSQLLDGQADGAAAAAAWKESDDALTRVLVVRSMQSAKVSFKPTDFSLKSAADAELSATTAKARGTIAKVRPTLQKLLALQIRRLEIALAMSVKAKPADNRSSKTARQQSDDDYGQYDLAGAESEDELQRITAALEVLSIAADKTELLRQRFHEFNVLLPFVRPDANSSSLVQDVVLRSKRANEALRDLHQILRSAPYPYDHTEKGATISRYCCHQLPNDKQIRGVHNAAESTLNGIFGLYMRMMSDLAERAERAEKEFDLSPLPEPAVK
jgi:Zn-dependent protease with chaperone function